MDDFYQIANLAGKCVKTFVRRYRGANNTTDRQILSEGCFQMEIINYSILEGIDFEFSGGEKIHLERGVDLDPTVGRAYRFDRIILPGHIALVRSDQFKFIPESDTGYDFVIIRHSVVDYKEGIVYPPQKNDKA